MGSRCCKDIAILGKSIPNSGVNRDTSPVSRTQGPFRPFLIPPSRSKNVSLHLVNQPGYNFQWDRTTRYQQKWKISQHYFIKNSILFRILTDILLLIVGFGYKNGDSDRFHVSPGAFYCSCLLSRTNLSEWQPQIIICLVSDEFGAVTFFFALSLPLRKNTYDIK